MGYRDYSTAKGKIVDSTGHGDFTTIQAAINASSSGQTIFVRPGTYTENPNITISNLVITAYSGDGTNYDGLDNSVVIKGKVNASTNVVGYFSGIKFTSNSDYMVEITGAAAVDFYFKDCYFDSATNSYFHYTGSAGGRIFFYDCSANLANTGIAYFVVAGSSTPAVHIYNSNFLNLSNSVTASTFTSATEIVIYNSNFANAINCASSSSVTIYNSSITTPTSGVALFVLSSTATLTCSNCFLSSGNNAILSAGAGTAATLTECTASSSAANVFTGAGTVNYSGVTFSGGSSTTNASTEAYFPLTVKQGGTGASTLTGPLFGNGTGAVTALTGNSKVVASNSSGTFSTLALSVAIQTFTGSGTYTPTSGMLYCVTEILGGGRRRRRRSSCRS